MGLQTCHPTLLEGSKLDDALFGPVGFKFRIQGHFGYLYQVILVLKSNTGKSIKVTQVNKE